VGDGGRSERGAHRRDFDLPASVLVACQGLALVLPRWAFSLLGHGDSGLVGITQLRSIGSMASMGLAAGVGGIGRKSALRGEFSAVQTERRAGRWLPPWAGLVSGFLRHNFKTPPASSWAIGGSFPRVCPGGYQASVGPRQKGGLTTGQPAVPPGDFFRSAGGHVGGDHGPGLSEGHSPSTPTARPSSPPGLLRAGFSHRRTPLLALIYAFHPGLAALGFWFVADVEDGFSLGWRRHACDRGLGAAPARRNAWGGRFSERPLLPVMPMADPKAVSAEGGGSLPQETISAAISSAAKGALCCRKISLASARACCLGPPILNRTPAGSAARNGGPGLPTTARPGGRQKPERLIQVVRELRPGALQALAGVYRRPWPPPPDDLTTEGGWPRPSGTVAGAPEIWADISAQNFAGPSAVAHRQSQGRRCCPSAPRLFGPQIFPPVNGAGNESGAPDRASPCSTSRGSPRDAGRVEWHALWDWPERARLGGWFQRPPAALSGHRRIQPGRAGWDDLLALETPPGPLIAGAG